jgi:alpha-tubulin suppressor-like RCC1 family protein
MEAATARRIAVVIACASAIALSLSPSSMAAASGTVIYEWGKPVAAAGPGRTPTPVQRLDAVAVDAGNGSDLAVLRNGTVWGWGATHVGRQSMKAVEIPGLVHVVQAPVDGNHDFAALEQTGGDTACPSSSSVMTWGLNQSGDLGIGDATNDDNYPTAQDVKTLDCQDVVQIAAAAQHMFALTASGRIFVWGGNGDDVLGLGMANIKRELIPTISPLATGLTGGTSSGVQLTAGSVTGGLLVNGHAYSWGSNALGQCGCGVRGSVISTPTPVTQGGVLFTWIDQGGNVGTDGHELALTASGAVYAWGDGAEGQLGDGTTTDSALPVLVPGLPAIVMVRAGGMHSLALDGGGAVWAWGANNDGQLGDGTHRKALRPEEVLSGMTLISAGSLHSIAA